MTAISVRNIKKVYQRESQSVTVLDGLSLELASGTFAALMGPSGSGKTTLLNLIGAIDQPTSGDILVDGKNIAQLAGAALSSWRASNIGFIFQTYNLMPVLTAVQNVELPLLLVSGMGRKERRDRARFALEVVGLADRLDHYPRMLSGGQEQRVAIARAIVADPRVLVADEPTGDLDRKSAEDVLDLLQRLHTEYQKTIVMVTHDPTAAERADVVFHLDKGELRSPKEGEPTSRKERGA